MNGSGPEYQEYMRKIADWIKAKPQDPRGEDIPIVPLGQSLSPLENPFTRADSVRDTLTIYGLDREFPGPDPVDGLAMAYVTVRKERDRYQSILESPDGIDVMVQEQKVGTADFRHWIVRVLARGLSGMLDFTESTWFEVEDPQFGKIVVTVKRKT